MSLENNQHTNNVDDIPRIRTFQSDIAEALKNQQGSVVKIAVKEQERKLEEGALRTQQKKKNAFFILGGLLLILITSGIFGYAYWQKQKQHEADSANIPQKKNFISGDHVTEIPIPDALVLTELVKTKTKETNAPVGQIEHMLLTYTNGTESRTQIPIEDIFSNFTITPPDGFYYSLVPSIYMFGFYQTTEQEKFILLKTKVFSNTFSQMLLWEKSMGHDFQELLGYTIEPDIEVTFKDKIIKNEDVRIGYIDDQEVISYVFFGPKKEFLLIAQKQETIQSLLGRFTTKLLEQ